MLAVDDVHGPFGGSEQQQILESNVAAVVDHITPGAGPMRVLHDPIVVSGASVRRVGCEVIPQLRIAIHVDGAPSRQAGILDIVKDNLGAQRPSPGRRPGGAARRCNPHSCRSPESGRPRPRKA